MIKRLLIANRGEIALRIQKTCKKMNIQSVSVYSDVDLDAPHVRNSDKAIHIGAKTQSGGLNEGFTIPEYHGSL